MKPTAIITGATRGIGKGLFRRLAAQGVNIATVYHQDAEAAERFEQEATRPYFERPGLFGKTGFTNHESAAIWAYYQHRGFIERLL